MDQAMAKEKVGYWDKKNMQYYQDRETFDEIADTFAEMFTVMAISQTAHSQFL
jgi:hypothetical protein